MKRLSLYRNSQPATKHFTVLIALTTCCLLLHKESAAQDYRWGFGLRLSNSSPTINTSFTGKYFIHEKSAIEGLVSFGSRFGIGALLELHQTIPGAEGLRWFYGAGTYIGWQDKHTYIGPMGVLGLDYKFPTAPVNLSIDWKPELDISPAVKFVPDAFALTVRFTLGPKP